jgi:hypothetical protein
MTAVSAFFGAVIMLVAIVALLHFVLMPWQAAAMRLLHRAFFFWHREHVFFLPNDKRPHGDLFCAVCNRRLRYVRGVNLELGRNHEKEKVGTKETNPGSEGI